MIVPFNAEHGIALGGDLERAQFYEAAGCAYTMLRDGRAIACAGLVGSNGDLYLWSITDSRLPLIAVHRAARRLLEVFGQRRLWAFCKHGNADGWRWLSMLGFTFAGDSVVVDGEQLGRFRREPV